MVGGFLSVVFFLIYTALDVAGHCLVRAVWVGAGYRVLFLWAASFDPSAGWLVELFLPSLHTSLPVASTTGC